MANIRLEDIAEGKRKAVQLIAEIGGFGDEYHAVSNTQYSSEMFLYDLNNLIDARRYKSIIRMLDNEYSAMNFEKENFQISEDEKLLRRSLRSMGYSDDNFFNPKYDKGELVGWDGTGNREKVFKVASVFKDSGVYFYSLRNIETGIQHGGRLHENDLREPSVVEKILYYKKQDMLEVHLFNRLVPLDKVSKDDGLALIEALKGVDIEHDNEDIREIAYATQKGFIDTRSHFNTLCMIAGSHELLNNPIEMKLKKDEIDVSEILELEKLAKQSIEVLDQYRKIYGDMKSLKKELNYSAGIEDEKLESVMVDLSMAVDKGYDKLDSDEVGKSYGSAYWYVRPNNPEIYKKIESLYEKILDFTQERDIYKLNRPDLSDVIRDANMQLDLNTKDMVLFRGSRNPNFDYQNMKVNFENSLKGIDSVELNLANNGFRREIYQSPTAKHGGSNFGYCEGDLTLCVPKNLQEFNTRLEHSVNFYCEDEGKSADETKKYLAEMKSKLGVDALGCKIIHQKIQNNEEVPASEFSKIDFESEAFNSLGDDVKETITNYVNERSDAINADALEKDKQQSTSTDLNV